MSEKVTFIKQLRGDASNLAVLFRNVSDRAPLYFDRKYDAGKANEITDADAQAAGLSGAADVTSMITLLEQLANFQNNLAVAQGDYGATLSTIRDDITGNSGV